ncbi:unnamed protein product [Aphanomyces euteiches]
MQIRATKSEKRRGGNGSNTLVVCSQLDVFLSLHWMGILVNPSVNSDARFIVQDLEAHGIDVSPCQIVDSGAMPTSYILSSAATGSRTIVHHRELDEVTVDHFEKTLPTLSSLGWIHFECRDARRTLDMIAIARAMHPTMPLSLEIEAPRHRWDLLQPAFGLVSYVFVSQTYVESLGYTDAPSFLDVLALQVANSSSLRGVLCPWGAQGAFYLENGSVQHIPVDKLAHVVSSVGAGDAFIAATMSALHAGQTLHQAVAAGCRVARLKCLQPGMELNQDDAAKNVFLHAS